MKKNELIKIITYNLGHGNYNELSYYKKDRTAFNFHNLFPSERKEITKNIKGSLSLIKSLNPNIILFQEVGKFTLYNRFVRQYLLLKKGLDSYVGIYHANHHLLGIGNQGKSTFIKEKNISDKLVFPYKLKGFFNNLTVRNKTVIKSKIEIEESDKYLVIYNIHLVPFRRNETIRHKQLQYIFDLAVKDYNEGNYVVIGGDFNLSLSKNDYIKELIKENGFIMSPLDGFTIRSLDTPYNKDSTTNDIDGFITSSNVEVIKTKVILDFRYSDHCPVEMIFKLK